MSQIRLSQKSLSAVGRTWLRISKQTCKRYDSQGQDGFGRVEA